jgi:hypothetical protein
MITLTMCGKCILKAFGYTFAILVEPLILAAIIWSVTGNPDLVSWFFWGGLLLGILAVLTAELKQREVVLVQQPPLPPVLTWNASGTHQVRTETTVALNVGLFALRVTRCTDLERTWNVPGQCNPAYTPTNQITQD